MTQSFVWSLVAICLAPQIAMIGLQFAPKSFWRGFSRQHRSAALFLWGFSHMFGPRAKPGEPAPWERLRDA